MRRAMRALRPLHREAPVDAEEDVEAPLGLEALHDDVAEATVDVPVHVAQVVARDVRPVLGEQAALAVIRAAPLAASLPVHGAATADAQALEPRQLLRA